MTSLISLIVVVGLANLASSPTPIPKPKVLTLSSIHDVAAPPFDYYGFIISDQEGDSFYRLDTGHFPDPIVMRLAHTTGDPAIMKPQQDRDHEWQLRSYNVTPSGLFAMLCLDVKSGKHALFWFDDEGKIRSTVSLEIPAHVDVMDIAVFEHGDSFVAGYYNPEAPEELRGRSYAALFSSSGLQRRNIKDVVPATELTKVGTDLHEGALTVGTDSNLYVLTGKGIVVLNASGGLVRFLPVIKPEKSFAVQLFYSQGWLLVAFAEPTKRGPINMHYAVIDAFSGDYIGYYDPSPELGGVAVSFSRREGISFLFPNKRKLELRTADLK